MCDGHNFYRLVRYADPQKMNVSEVTEASDDSLIHPQGHRLECWADHFRRPLSWPTVTESLPLFAWKWSNIGAYKPSIQMKVIIVMGFLERHNSALLNGPSPFLFKDDGEVLTSKLTKLFWWIWINDGISKSWCESVLAPISKEGDRCSRESHRGISLVSIASKPPSVVVLHRLPVLAKGVCVCGWNRFPSWLGLYWLDFHFGVNFRK